MARSKKDIAKVWRRLTFSKMEGVSERSGKELKGVLAFEKRLRKKR